MHHDLARNGVVIGHTVCFSREVRQNDIGTLLPQKNRQPPDRFRRDQENGIVRSKERDILHTQDSTRLPDFFGLDVRSFSHDAFEFRARRHLFFVKHLFAHHRIVNACPVRENDTSHVIPAANVMRHRPTRLIEDVSGVCAD